MALDSDKYITYYVDDYIEAGYHTEELYFEGDYLVAGYYEGETVVVEASASMQASTTLTGQAGRRVVAASNIQGNFTVDALGLTDKDFFLSAFSNANTSILNERIRSSALNANSAFTVAADYQGVIKAATDLQANFDKTIAVLRNRAAILDAQVAFFVSLASQVQKPAEAIINATAEVNADLTSNRLGSVNTASEFAVNITANTLLSGASSQSAENNLSAVLSAERGADLTAFGNAALTVSAIRTRAVSIAAESTATATPIAGILTEIAASLQSNSTATVVNARGQVFVADLQSNFVFDNRLLKVTLRDRPVVEYFIGSDPLSLTSINNYDFVTGKFDQALDTERDGFVNYTIPSTDTVWTIEWTSRGFQSNKIASLNDSTFPRVEVTDNDSRFLQLIFPNGSYTSDETFPASSFNTYAISRNNSEVKFYFNGSLEHTFTDSFLETVDLELNFESITIDQIRYQEGIVDIQGDNKFTQAVEPFGFFFDFDGDTGAADTSLEFRGELQDNANFVTTVSPRADFVGESNLTANATLFAQAGIEQTVNVALNSVVDLEAETTRQRTFVSNVSASATTETQAQSQVGLTGNFATTADVTAQATNRKLLDAELSALAFTTTVNNKIGEFIAILNSSFDTPNLTANAVFNSTINLQANSAVDVDADQIFAVEETLSANAALTTPGETVRRAIVTTQANVALAVSSDRLREVESSLTANSTVVGNNVVVTGIGSIISASSVLTADNTRSRFAQSQQQANFTSVFNTDTALFNQAEADLASSTTLATVPTRVKPISVNMSGVNTAVTISAKVGSVIVTARSTAQLNIDADFVVRPSLTLTATASTAAVPLQIKPLSAASAASSTTTANATTDFTGSVAAQANFNLSADANKLFGFVLGLDANFTLDAVPLRIEQIALVASSFGTLEAIPLRIQSVESNLNSTATVTAVPTAVFEQQATLEAFQTVLVDVRAIHPELIVYKIPAETRVYTIPIETRLRKISEETRIYEIGGY